MNVAELEKYLQEHGISLSGYLKTLLVEITSVVERMVLPVDPNFEKDQTTDADKLIIHNLLIPNPFSLKTISTCRRCLCCTTDVQATSDVQSILEIPATGLA